MLQVQSKCGRSVRDDIRMSLMMMIMMETMIENKEYRIEKFVHC